MGKEIVVRDVLGAEKQTALELLLTGTSIAETARSAGVARSTLYLWLKEDAAFQAAYNQWHEEMQESCRSRLLILTDKAASAVEKALEAGDAKAGLALLKGMGLLKPVAAGPTDPEELIKRAVIEKKKRKAKMNQEEFEADLGAL